MARTSCPLWIQREVLKRDGEDCFYCGTDQGPFEWDHGKILFREHEQWDVADTRRACVDCNRGKGRKARWDRYRIRKQRRLEKAFEALMRGEEKAKKHKPIPSKPMGGVPEGMKYNWKTGRVEKVD